MRKLGSFIISCILLIASFFIFYHRPAMTADSILGEISDPPELYFCPQDDCIAILKDIINKSEKIECAIYNIKDASFIKLLEEKHAKIVIDKNYAKNLEGYDIDFRTNRYYLMHNKFCIFDDTTIYTGSFNIVDNKDDNNVFIIHSKSFAKNYADEFFELYNEKYDEKTKNPRASINGILFESYFCPEDWCAEKIIKEIRRAEESIIFMAFSFTHDEIADELIKKKNEGLTIAGIVEKSQENNYSEYKNLKSAGIDALLDSGKKLMHHKVFIIDNKTVITGSMNPTANGDTKNDENILIIRNGDVARRFLAEFERLKNRTNAK